jgi:hypothetical protein
LRHMREDSPARCNTLNRQVHNRVCSVFVIASPCRILDKRRRR